MDRIQPPVPDNPRVARALGAAGLLIVAITLALAGLLFSSYRSTIEREQTNLRNLAAAYAAQTYYAMLALDTALAHGTGGVAVPAAMSDDMAARVYILGPDGQPRPAGPAARPGNDAPVTLPEPHSPALVALGDRGRAGKHTTITLARALPGGGAGRIVIEADAGYFQRIFASSDLGSGGSVTLLRRDGIMLVRGPALPDAIGRSFLNTPLFQVHLPRARAGAFEAVSPIDGKRRLYGYSAVDDYPLVIITGRDQADTLAVWRGWLLVAVLAWALLSAALALLAWRFGRETSRQAALIARLETSEGRLSHSFRYLNSILDSLATPLWVLDAQRRIVLFNKAFLQFTGKPAETLDGRPESDVLDPHGAAARERLYAAAAADGAQTREAEIRNGAGEPRTALHLAARLDSEDHGTQIVNSLADITERKQVELRLAWLSDFDPLTGLPNQNRLRRTLSEAIEAARAQGGQVVLILAALERLHEVADLLGHEAGDEAVRQVAARLGGLAPPAVCPARVKANEFGLLLPAAAAHGPLDDFAFELHALLSEPVRVREREFHLEPVIGIAVYPEDAGSVNELMRLADIAKHHARGEGGEPVHFHSESTHVQLDERLSIEEQLRRALARGELRLAYQPKVALATGRITGFEVLLRWHNPVLGEVSPARFIPIAEQTGLILPIGNWVLRSACEQASAWLRDHGVRLKVAVNLSIRQFYQKDLLRSIEEALGGAGLAPGALELEITESIAMSRIDVVERLLAGIRALGVELAIDDFGTGHSSLAYLKRFPVQCLKIDRAFIHDLGQDAESEAIVRSIVALGRGLKMRIVAEGVETDRQLAMLRELGCDEYQGFLFARPLDAAAVPALLAAHTERLAS